MRLLILSAIVAFCPFALPGRCLADEPKEVVAKAIAAYGGEQKVAKLGAVQFKAKGKLINWLGVPFVMETSIQLPDFYKTSYEIEFSGQRLTLAQVLNGEKGWGAANGSVAPVEGRKLDDLKSNLYLRRLLSLTPLLNDKSLQLSAIDDAEVDGKPALGVKVVAAGQHDVLLWFDKKTGLLAKLRRVVYEDDTKRDVEQEEFFRDYKLIAGIPTPMKQRWQRRGADVLEMEVVECKYPGRIDAREFSSSAIERPYRLTSEVVYGRRTGLALTYDVYTPKARANGAAIIFVLSGGWYSDRAVLGPFAAPFINSFVARGYTVFVVVHGSQPIFTIPDAVADVDRAVRFIRLHAKEYRIDSDRIGIAGASAGGHLSLMQAMAGDTGNPTAVDLLDRVSSRVQAVACFYPPTDFLNYGEAGKYAFDADGLLSAFRTAIDVRALDQSTHRLERLDDEKQREIARQVSPITHVSADDPPTLIVHGDADKLVPISQAEAMVAKFRAVGVPAELIVKKGAAHGWPNPEKEIRLLADWFDKYLAKK
jgi:acetyl esterase/lipase